MFRVLHDSYIILTLQEPKQIVRRKNPPPRPLNMIVKVMPQVKKAKLDLQSREEASERVVKSPEAEGKKSSDKIENESKHTALAGLVSYSDESDED